MHVSGRHLLDACGEVFVVRGVEQILGRELPEGNDWLGLIDQIAASGANAVRILPGVTTLTVKNIDDVLALIGRHSMVAYLGPLNDDGSWLGRADVKAMLAKHESYLIIDAYGEPQYDDREQFRSEALQAIRKVRDLGYRVPITITANQFGRDLPSILQYGSEFEAADPLHNVMLGWQAYWGQSGYYQEHYGLTFTQAVRAIVDSGLPVQLGLDHITDLPSTEADYGQLMTAAEANDISWLWWDWYNPYGSENNLSRDGTVAHLTATGMIVVNSHAASMANTAVLTCEGDAVSPPPPPPPPPAVTPFLSINAGGSADGAFLADRDVTGGNTAPRTTVAIDRSLVPTPAPAESVYQTERWGAMTYRIPGLVARSTHRVELHFAEVYFSRAGQRKFNVSINGTRLLSNFDIFAEAGASNRAIVRTFDATASASGEIVINFSVGSANQPKVSGIVVR
jgi:hypothetical protein